MKKIDIGQMITILANIGVIGSIGFLALEIRQNNDQMTAQSRFNYYQNRIAAYNDIAHDGELASLLARAMAGAELSPVEMNRVSQRMLALITSWEYEYGEYEKGRLSLGEFNVAAKRSVYLILQRPMSQVWATYRDLAPPSFADFMDEHVFGA